MREYTQRQIELIRAVEQLIAEKRRNDAVVARERVLRLKEAIYQAECILAKTVVIKL